MEIVFFTVKEEFQSKGYGQRLMCYMKGMFLVYVRIDEKEESEVFGDLCG